MKYGPVHRETLRIATAVLLTGYASVAVAATMVPLSVINQITMPLFGVPLTVLFMAATGALIGAGYTEPMESRKKLYFFTLANTLFAAWFVILIPEWRGWVVSPVAQPPLAGVIAAANCVVIPLAFKALPGWFGEITAAVRAAIGRLFNRPPTGGGTP